MIPLISGKPLAAFAPAEFKKHIESLYEDCPIRLAKREADLPRVLFKWTASGKPSILVHKREPKFITHTEADLLAKTHKIPKNTLFLYLKKRQIELRPGIDCRITADSLLAVRPVLVAKPPKEPKPQAKKTKKRGSKKCLQN